MDRKKIIAIAVFVISILIISRKGINVNLSMAEAQLSAVSNFGRIQSNIHDPKDRIEKALDKTEKKLIRNSSQKMLTNPSQEEIYCKLKNLNLGIPLEGDIKIVVDSYQSDENGAAGTVAWISSSECPAGYYSKVRIDSNGNLLDLIDCRRTTKNELAMHSGRQGNITKAPPEPNHINFAISGPGFFIEDCDGILSYVRSGQFLIAPDGSGTVITKSACEIIAEDGRPLTVRQADELDEQGCNLSGQCIAVANPEAKDVAYNGDEKFSALTSPERILLQKKYLFKNAYEDLSASEFGPFGPEFSKLPILKLKHACAVQ